MLNLLLTTNAIAKLPLSSQVQPNRPVVRPTVKFRDLKALLFKKTTGDKPEGNEGNGKEKAIVVHSGSDSDADDEGSDEEDSDGSEGGSDDEDDNENESLNWHDLEDISATDGGELLANKIANLRDPRLRDLLSDTPVGNPLSAPSRSPTTATLPETVPVRPAKDEDFVFS